MWKTARVAFQNDCESPRAGSSHHQTSASPPNEYFPQTLNILYLYLNAIIMVIIDLIFDIIRLFFELIIGFIRFIFGIKSKASKSKYQGKMMSWLQRVRLANRWKKGLALDGKNLRLSEKDSLLHACIVGPTGSLKSTIQYANAMQLDGSVFIIDVDGKARKTIGGQQTKIKGKKEVVFHFGEPQISDQKNPLDEVHNHSDGKALAHDLVSGTYMPNNNSSNVFWEYSATSLLALLINVTKRMEPKYNTLSNVRHLCQNLLNIQELMTKYCCPILWSEYVALMSMEPKALSGVQASALVCLDQLSDPVIQHLTARSTFSIDDFYKEPTIIYFIVPESHISQYAVYIKIFLQSILKRAIAVKPIKPAYFILDEFAQIPFDPNFISTYSTVLRRYGCSLIFLLQSYQQLVSRYGEAHARTIFYGSCGTKVLMPGSDIQLAKEMSSIFGRKGIQIENDKGGYNTDVEVLTPREIIQMKKGCIVYHRNLPPLKVKKVYPFFKQRKLRKLSKIKPPKRNSKPLEKPAFIPIPKTNIL